jgi:hypothetical protein
MPYYDTLEEDLIAARQILADRRAIQGPTLTDTLKLLESFIAEIERLREVLHLVRDPHGTEVLNQLHDAAEILIVHDEPDLAVWVMTAISLLYETARIVTERDERVRILKAQLVALQNRTKD